MLKWNLAGDRDLVYLFSWSSLFRWFRR